MSTTRVLRHEDLDELVADGARHLLDTLVALQASQETVHLCLTGGSTSTRVLQAFADLVPGSELDPSTLHLWWTDDAFVPTTAPERNALQALSVLARTMSLSSAQTHPMPASDGKADPGEAAFAYAQELGETVFDICLLGMGPEGHVASILPGTFGEPTSQLAVGVTDAPTPPSERISLTLNAINRSRRVWFGVSGTHKAEALAGALAGDPALPASHVHGTGETLWFVDEQAAALVPFHECEF